MGGKNNIDTDWAIKLYDNHFTPKIYEKIVEARIRTHGGVEEMNVEAQNGIVIRLHSG